MDSLLHTFSDLAPWVTYLVLAGGAAAENVFPVIPADTFVLAGGLLAGRGLMSPVLIFAFTWLANVLGALLVYKGGIRFGEPFFQSGLGRHLLNPRQLRRLALLHGRWGIPAIFVSRFLPGLRALVPVFAGVSGMRFHQVAIPTAFASAIWYGTLVWIGMQAGENLERILELLAGANRLLLLLSVLLAALLAFWWRRTRSGEDR
jgi:membrane protein DedA with SNARE-associated domain